MDLIKDIVYEKRYMNINIDDYTQHKIIKENKIIKEIVACKNLEELLLYKYDYNSVLENENAYVEQRKIELASFIDEHTEKTYDNFNYDKRFSKKLIQRGLQENDALTSVLYISDLYNFGIVLYDKIEEKYYKLYSKIKPEIYVCYENRTFRIIDKPIVDIKYTDKLDGLTNILNLNIKDVYIYKKYLKPISNYKIGELVDIAKELNVNIMKNNKRMTKQEIYDAINLSKY
jgi:hypothetical protein